MTLPARLRTVGVIGGGTAGYLSALALKRRFPDLSVTLVESDEIPIIGVGEATTTLMPPFLHGQLGLDVVELFAAVKPTFKLGIKFEWGLPDQDYFFNFPFGDADPISAAALDGDLRNQSLTSMLMTADRAPLLRGPDGQLLSLLGKLKFAYHLDNQPFVAFLAAAAKRAGILHESMTIDAVIKHAGQERVDTIRAADGRELRFDFYVDASGFHSLLLERSLGSPFVDYSPSLFCDRAVVATLPRPGVIQPYTTAETMPSGWCWRIPVAGEDHRGYVYSSAFLDEEAAIAEMRAANPRMGEPRIVRFRSGRHRDFWRGNTVAIGNSYGFVEPLESTALHMVIVEIAYLLAGFEALDADRDSYVGFANQAVGAHWDFLRWFLAIHYKHNRRLDTPFWRAVRAETDSSGLDSVVERYRREGPSLSMGGKDYEPGDPAFGFSGVMMLLLGQQVPAPVSPRAGVSRSTWEARIERERQLVDQALPQREALGVLLGDPRWLEELANGDRSWCRGNAERVIVSQLRREMVHPNSDD